MSGKSENEWLQGLSLNWGLSESFKGENQEESLKEALFKAILELLNNDFEKLGAIMYRLDVNEKLFWTALEANSMEERAGQITELVIEREKQRLASRKRYKKEE